jgi:hypothetical protein
MANYRVSTNRNNNNMTAQNTRITARKQGKIHELMLFKFKPEFLNASVDLQAAFAV